MSKYDLEALQQIQKEIVKLGYRPRKKDAPRTDAKTEKDQINQPNG